MAVEAASGSSANSTHLQVQVNLLRRSQDIQEQQVAQLIEALPQPQAVAPGQPGGVINTYA